jgi:hypothetical protein
MPNPPRDTRTPSNAPLVPAVPGASWANSASCGRLAMVTSKVPFLPFAQEIDSDCKRVGVQLEVEGVMRYGYIPDDQVERFAGRIPMPWLLSDCCAVIAPCSTSNKFVERIGISWLRFEKCVS